jgi:hypothetical protein
MDTDSEVRTAILALVRAHWKLLGLYRATNQTLDAAVQQQPDLGWLRRGITKIVQVEWGIAEQQAADVESALNNNQQFADLLRLYAGPDLLNLA